MDRGQKNQVAMFGIELPSSFCIEPTYTTYDTVECKTQI